MSSIGFTVRSTIRILGRFLGGQCIVTEHTSLPKRVDDCCSADTYRTAAHTCTFDGNVYSTLGHRPASGPSSRATMLNHVRINESLASTYAGG
jgi:hypothetical protein